MGDNNTSNSGNNTPYSLQFLSSWKKLSCKLIKLIKGDWDILLAGLAIAVIRDHLHVCAMRCYW
jgi:hypothetical protein